MAPKDETQDLDLLLAGLRNYERTRPSAQTWSLAGMERLLVPLPPLTGLAVQVGGSKGKGTTALYLEALAKQAGLSVGTYLSPHLQHVTERVRVDGEPVSTRRLVSALEKVLAATDDASPPTFFEALTAAAVVVFAERQVDLAVFEVGLGGRLDATTAIPVDATIVTGVELEHTEVLGDSVAAIAAEKAAILRQGRPAFTAATGDALGVVRARARDLGCPLQVLGEDLLVLDLVDHGTALTGRLRLGQEGAAMEFRLPGAGFEVPAMALAVACLRTLRPDLRPSLTPVPRPALAGRFEVLDMPDGHPLILDGAHTEASLEQVARELRRRYPGQAMVVLWGSARGKGWQAGLSRLLPVVDSFLVTEIVGTAAEDPDEMVTWLAERSVPARVVRDVDAGVRELLDTKAVRLVTGSFYLVGSARDVIRKIEPPV